MVGAGESKVLVRIAVSHHNEIGVCRLLSAVQGICQRDGARCRSLVLHADARFKEPLVVQVEPHHIHARNSRKPAAQCQFVAAV